MSTSVLAVYVRWVFFFFLILPETISSKYLFRTFPSSLPAEFQWGERSVVPPVCLEGVAAPSCHSEEML